MVDNFILNWKEGLISFNALRNITMIDKTNSTTISMMGLMYLNTYPSKRTVSTNLSILNTRSK